MVTTEVIIPSMSLCPFVHHYWIMKTCWNEHVIGFSRGIPFNHTEACATCWNEYVGRIVKPVYMVSKWEEKRQDK